jgi:hypothetical protein
MLLLLLEGFNSGPQQCPELVAYMSRQVVACLSQGAGDAELLPVLMQALLLALVATVGSIAADPGSTEMHVRVWQHAQDLLQVSMGQGSCLVVIFAWCWVFRQVLPGSKVCCCIVTTEYDVLHVSVV